DLNSKWLKDNMPRLLTQAMDNPTPENLSRFYTAQRLMLDIGTRFSDKSKDYFLKNPMMSEKRRQPVEKVALDAHRTVVEKNQQTVMKDIFTRSGLFFFFQSTCEFCHEESQILQFMQNYYSVDILPVSMDGRPLQNGLFQDFSVPNAQIIDQFKIREVPTIFLVSKDGSSAQRISEGMITAEELKNTIILAAKGMNLIDDASFQSTLDIKRQYTIGEDGVITVNKSEMESDPFLLQRIMDQKLEGYDMPTADPVNYLNVGGSLGGPYAR
ncbi:conjugal transfer protein TraF, partial [Enterobacter hormaechei]|nr:conjugal transfer protein TraF [Enterobacter hormaechei]